MASHNGYGQTPLPSLVITLLRLPVINRLGLDRRPQELVRFLKFAVVGAMGMLVDIAVLTFMMEIGLPNLAPWLATAPRLRLATGTSFTLAVISNFTWNRMWTFPESRKRPILGQLARFALVNVIGLAINLLVVDVLFHMLEPFMPAPGNYLVPKVVAIGIVLFWNYVINRLWTYRGIQ